ncbi:hypothetical protein ABRY18_04450 [Clostridioides difficile]
MLNEEARQKILNLPVDTNKRFEDIENLKEVPNVSYVADNGECSIENSKKGYLTNFNIQGKTLIDLWGKTSSDFSLWKATFLDGKINILTEHDIRYSNFFTTNCTLYKPDTIYTIIVDVDKNTLPSTSGIYIHSLGEENSVFIPNLTNIAILGGVIGEFRYTFTTISDLSDCNVVLRSVLDNDTLASGYEVSLSMTILEGDYLNTNIDYFKGIQSVGQGDKIEILSTEINIPNLIKSDYIYTKGKYNRFNGGYLDTDNKHYACEEFIEIKGNTEYVFYGLNGNRQYYDSNKNFIQGISSPEQHFKLTRNSSWRYWVEKTPSNAHFIKVTLHIDNLINGKAILFEGNKFDKKLIPYTLRSLPNGVRDEIVYKNGCYKLIQRCEEIILDGQEVWSELTANATSETLLFNAPRGASVSGTNNTDLHCDKFKVSVIWGTNCNFEGIYETKTNIWIRIFKSRLTTQNVEGFKTWLANNNVTIIRQKETKKIELASLNLEQYDNQTRFICNSGIAIPNISFESTQNLGSHIEVIRENLKDITSIVKTESNIDFKFINGWDKVWQSATITKVGKYLFVNMIVTKNTSSTVLEEAIIKLPLGISRQNYSCPVMNSSCEQVDTVGIACVNNTILMLTPGHDITNKGILISVVVNLEV